jgi:putative ABC transport system permease protein
VTLLVAQIALAMAIVSNAFFIITQNIKRIERATGLDEQGLFLVTQRRIESAGLSVTRNLANRKGGILEDLAALRGSPYVDSASVINTLPLTGSNFRSGGVNLRSDQRNPTAEVSFYYGDENMLSTLGLRLIAGRSFGVEDVNYTADAESESPAAIIITSALARVLFQNRDPLGRQVYLDDRTSPSTIVGVIDVLQSASVAGWAQNFAWNSVIVPKVQLDSYTSYVVRAKPNQLDKAMADARARLYSVSRLRILDERSVTSFADIRRAAYRSDFGVAVIMATICVILLTITAGSIVGVSSAWVTQRRKQIGIRRSLGARKIDVAIYFITENVLVTANGVLLGFFTSFALNSYLRKSFELDLLPWSFFLVGACVVFLVSFLGVIHPAWKGSKVSPMVATRSI